MPYIDKDGYPEILMHPDIKTGRTRVRVDRLGEAAPAQSTATGPKTSPRSRDANACAGRPARSIDVASIQNGD